MASSAPLWAAIFSNAASFPPAADAPKYSPHEYFKEPFSLSCNEDIYGILCCLEKVLPKLLKQRRSDTDRRFLERGVRLHNQLLKSESGRHSVNDELVSSLSHWLSELQLGPGAISGLPTDNQTASKGWVNWRAPEGVISDREIVKEEEEHRPPRGYMETRGKESDPALDDYSVDYEPPPVVPHVLPPSLRFDDSSDDEPEMPDKSTLYDGYKEYRDYDYMFGRAPADDQASKVTEEVPRILDDRIICVDGGSDSSSDEEEDDFWA